MATQFPLGYSYLDDTNDEEGIRKFLGFPTKRVDVFITRLSRETASIKMEAGDGSVVHMLYFSGLPNDDLGFKQGYRVWIESVSNEGVKLSFYDPALSKNPIHSV